MLSASEERLSSLWLKAMAAHDPAEIESLLWEFRDALHEHIEQMRAERHPIQYGATAKCTQVKVSP